MKINKILLLLTFVFALGTNVNAQNNITNDFVKFDGKNDYISVPDYEGVSGGKARTVEAWIRTKSKGDRCIISWGSYGNSQKYVIRIAKGKLRFEHGGGNVISDMVVADNQWHHVAVSFDNNQTLRDLKMYVDGELVSVKRKVTSAEFKTTKKGAINIGADMSLMPIGQDRYRFWKGDIADIRLWSVCRTDAQIKKNFNKEIKNDETLELYYDFLQQEGNSVEHKYKKSHSSRGAVFADGTSDKKYPVWSSKL